MHIFIAGRRGRGRLCQRAVRSEHTPQAVDSVMGKVIETKHDAQEIVKEIKLGLQEVLQPVLSDAQLIVEQHAALYRQAEQSVMHSLTDRPHSQVSLFNK